MPTLVSIRTVKTVVEWKLIEQVLVDSGRRTGGILTGVSEFSGGRRPSWLDTYCQFENNENLSVK